MEKALVFSKPGAKIIFHKYKQNNARQEYNTT